MKKTFILIFIIAFPFCYSLINAEFIKSLEDHFIVETHLVWPKAQCVLLKREYTKIGECATSEKLSLFYQAKLELLPASLKTFKVNMVVTKVNYCCISVSVKTLLYAVYSELKVFIYFVFQRFWHTSCCSRTESCQCSSWMGCLDFTQMQLQIIVLWSTLLWNNSISVL